MKMKLEREEKKGEKVEGRKMRSRCTSHVTLQAAIPKGENAQWNPRRTTIERSNLDNRRYYCYCRGRGRGTITVFIHC